MAGEATRFKPGVVTNPEGKNQYTYRRDFERAVDRLLASKYTPRFEPVEEGECLKSRCLLCGALGVDIHVGEGMTAHESCAEQIEGLSRGEVIALTTVQRAMQGDERMLPEVLKRLWPGVERQEHTFPDGLPERPQFKTPAQHREKLAELMEERQGETLQ